MESMPVNPKYTVEVRDLQKSYKRTNSAQHIVFKNVNLHLPQGTIYGLLGPSGCGKTSLLRCILGRLKVTRGTVLVFGHRPGTVKSGIPGPNIGYMPQETCIYPTMTIAECLRYFGTIVGIPEGKINSAIDYFIKILNLPPKDTLNGTLSGGQLRRVAFVVALMHEPKLLILDEPTVGIDPITKECMWTHLKKLANENKTSIIITTHYIEEARAANMVGFMHNNTLAEEGYTDQLLVKYNCRTLEDVFLIICCSREYNAADDMNSNKEEMQSEDSGRTCKDVWILRKDSDDCRIRKQSQVDRVDSIGSSVELSQEEKSGCNWTLPFSELRLRRRILNAVIMKNLINFCRFPGALIFLIILPAWQVISATYASSGTISANLVVFNEDFGTLGDQYLSYLNPLIVKQWPVNSSEEGMKVLLEGSGYGVMTIRQNFSEAFWKRILNGPLETDDTLLSGTIGVTMDDTQYFVSTVIRYQLLGAFQHFMDDLLGNNSMFLNPSFSTPVLMFEKSTLESFNFPSVTFTIVGTMIQSAYFAPMGVAILNLFLERKAGYLERTYIAGVSSAEVIMGVVVLLLIMLVPQVVLALGVAYPIYSGCSTFDIFGIFLLMYFQGISGLAIGLFISMAFQQVYALLLIAGLVMTVGAGLGGYLWPIQALTYYFRYLYLALPIAIPIKAINAAIYHGFDITRTDILLGFGLSTFYAVLFIAITLLLFRFRQ